MKIQMQVVDSKILDGYIDENIVPFAVCVSTKSTLSKRQQRFLEKYYDRVEGIIRRIRYGGCKEIYNSLNRRIMRYKKC